MFARAFGHITTHVLIVQNTGHRYYWKLKPLHDAKNHGELQARRMVKKLVPANIDEVLRRRDKRNRPACWNGCVHLACRETYVEECYSR